MVVNPAGPKQRPSGMQSFLSSPSPPCLCETRVCLAVQSAGCWQRVSLQVMQSSHSQSTGCRAAGASLLMLLPLALSLPSCLDPSIIFPHTSCFSSFSLAGSQPAPALPTATKSATLEHPLFHGSVTQILEAAEALPAGSPILTRAGRKSSIKKC